MIKRLKYFYTILLGIFVRANFNLKSKDFEKLYDFNPSIFFNDTVSNEMNIDGFYEKEQLEVIKPFLDNNIFLDIGSNLGNHTLYFNKNFKEIYCFEPHPLSYSLLKLNTKYKSNIKIFNFGLSEKSKTANIKIKSQKNISGENFKNNNDIDKDSITEDVFFKNFDELYNFKDSLSFIKIDVEGNELDVIKSMTKNLENNSANILLEFDVDNFSEKNEIISLLKSVGYRYFYFFETNKIPNLRIRNLFLIFFKVVFLGYKEKSKII